ncbi:PHD finger protein 7-like [Gallus gallus]|uniref:PHD finger protein 7 n=1 Tax=Gallus gallus TaxID=9031 RepID=UPI000739CDEB|nr:PHD finger protein 7 [Gallus gallus]XP_040502570.1 PHD finger protein 7-like [Gallus gallus]|eukprot:XP_015148973.1 PHD finger protein 7 isoform X2 [Gallus gallus]
MGCGAELRLRGSGGAQCDLVRLARGGESPALMGQTLRKWLPSTRTVCVETQEAAGSREPACVLCGRVDEDSSILGHKKELGGFYFHEFCAMFANDLCEHVEAGRMAQFSRKDLIRTVRQAEQTLCFVCGKTGATITCAALGCDRSFHLPCASEGQCVTLYIGKFRSLCWEHRPQQAVEAAPAQDTTCIICMEPVGDSRSYSTMVCPSCQHAWFHRACIQEQAMRAGIYCFQCPLCRDRDWFLRDMVTMGIRIPFRKPTWEDNNAYASLRIRHDRCDASSCLYPRGRERAEREGPWQLLLCSSCAAQGTHRRCSFLSQGTASWECNACAGEGTASGSGVDRAGPSTASQQGLPPLIGPITLESSSTSSTTSTTSTSSTSSTTSTTSTTSQAPSGPAHVPKVPESGVPPNQHRTKWRRICTRLHRIDDEWNEPQECCGSSRAAALLSVESSTPNSASQGTSRPSRHSRAAGSSHRRRRGQQDRTRSRSPLQRQAAGSPSQPQRHRGSRQAPALSDESGTHRHTGQGTPRSSRVSAAAAGSRSRQPGRARTRSRSPRQHRDADTRSQPHRRRRSRSRRRRPAQGRRPLPGTTSGPEYPPPAPLML